jgi:hypothetical protein
MAYNVADDHKSQTLAITYMPVQNENLAKNSIIMFISYLQA